MAERRMFSKKITDSDAFYEMSSAAQALYFHLNQAADDDGFNNQIQIAMFKAHASSDDLKILMAKKFIIRFENGVIVIKHWRLHNTIRKDRYTPTNFKKELALLNIKENGSYTLSEIDRWLPSGCQVVATGKDSIGKDSIGEESIVETPSENPPQRTRFTPPSLEEVQAYCKERNKGVNAEKWYNHYTAKGWMIGKTKMKDWKAAVRTWEQDETKQEAPKEDNTKYGGTRY